jgi:rare lipoprotein A (peptidoglycan hydrolase)
VTFSYAGRSVTATVIDRGPFRKGYAWDLTKKTAKRVGFLSVGAGPIQATVTPPPAA